MTLRFDGLCRCPARLSPCQAIARAHAHGIIHRDIKERNMIVNLNEDRLWLIDFGIGDYYFPGTAPCACQPHPWNSVRGCW